MLPWDTKMMGKSPKALVTASLLSNRVKGNTHNNKENLSAITCKVKPDT